MLGKAGCTGTLAVRVAGCFGPLAPETAFVRDLTVGPRHGVLTAAPVGPVLFLPPESASATAAGSPRLGETCPSPAPCRALVQVIHGKELVFK